MMVLHPWLMTSKFLPNQCVWVRRMGKMEQMCWVNPSAGVRWRTVADAWCSPGDTWTFLSLRTLPAYCSARLSKNQSLLSTGHFLFLTSTWARPAVTTDHLTQWLSFFSRWNLQPPAIANAPSLSSLPWMSAPSWIPTTRIFPSKDTFGCVFSIRILQVFPSACLH